MNMRINQVFVLSIALCSFVLAGCDMNAWKQYRIQKKAASKEGEAIVNAIETIPTVSQFNKLFPHAHYGITRFAGRPGDQSLWAEILLYDRHILTVKMTVSLGSDPAKIVSHGSPTFVINEYAFAGIAEDGRFHLRTNVKNCHTFTEKEWSKLVAAKGDFSAIGIQLVKDKPLKELRKHWNANKPKHSP